MKINQIIRAAVVGFGALFTANVMAAEEPIVLKFASPFPAVSTTNKVSVPEFIKAVEEASEGTLKIQFYPGGSLGSNPAAQLKLIEDGVVDFAEVVASYTPGRFPEMELFELPFLFTTTKEASLVSWDMYEKGYLSGFDRVKLVGVAQVGPYYLHSRKKLEKLSDLRGKKYRVGGATQGSMMKDMKAIPVGGIAATQIAENISRGTLDGTLLDMGNMYNFRVSDTATYHVENVPLGNVAILFPMNKDKYDSLPDKAKAALDQFSGKWFSTVIAENLDKQNEDVKQRLIEDKKHHMVKLSESDIEKLKGDMAHLTEKFNKDEKGVNLYQEALKSLERVRAQQ